MIERATNADFINRVANHPDVRPHVFALPGELDLSPVVANTENYALQSTYGAMLFMEAPLAPSVFEIHTLVMPEGRGPWALEFAHEAVRWMFCRTRCNEVFTRVPEGNVAAMALARACGAKPEHKTVQNLNGSVKPVEIYGGRVQDWLKVAPGLIDLGTQFHDRLQAKAIASGLKINHHPEDIWHDRHVGAATEMILGGQVLKGVILFNRWAAMAMAPPIKVISSDPLILDITDCRLKIQGDDFEVVPCQ